MHHQMGQETKVQFSEYELDLGTGILRKNGERLPLQDRSFQVLHALLERPGELVTREELCEELWGNDTYVDFDDNLNHIVSRLRDVLGDSAGNPRFLETIPRKGYRFIGDVERRSGRRRKKVLVSIILGAFILVTIGAVTKLAEVRFFGLEANESERVDSEPAQIRPLTSDGIRKEGPQLSPDGQFMTYWVFPQLGSNPDIFVKSTAAGSTPLQLTKNFEWDSSPVWSPDGKQLAFLRATDGNAKRVTIYTISAPIGGHERRVIELVAPLDFQQSQYLWSLSWSAEGKWLAAVEKPSEDRPSRIVLVSPKTGEKRPLTKPPDGILGDSNPRFSPDGKLVAFVRTLTAFSSDYWVQSIKSSEAQQLTFDNYVRAFAFFSWTPDGQEIVFSAGTDLPSRRLYRVGVNGGSPKAVAGLGMGVGDISIRGDHLAFAQRYQDRADIWRVPGPGSKELLGPERIIWGNRMFSDENPALSPDGQRIAFSSSRSDALEIWLAGTDGSNPTQVSRFQYYSDCPSWDPNGLQLAFQSNVGGNMDIYIDAVSGGKPKRLTGDPSDDGQPRWSHDGRWIYFTSNRSGHPQVWKMPADGGQAIQLTRKGGSRPIESLDRNFVYYHKAEKGIWRVPADGGTEIQVLQEAFSVRNWDIQGNRLYYGISEKPNGKGFSVYYFDLDSGETTEVYRQGTSNLSSLAASPDGRWIYCALLPGVEVSADIWLVENFH